MTTKQLKYVYGLLRKNGLEDMKDELVHIHTKGRTSSLREMDYFESQSLINALNLGVAPAKSSRDRMMAKVYSIAHELRWELPSGKVDRARLDAFCKTRTSRKKPLAEWQTNELPELVTVMERVALSFIKGI